MKIKSILLLILFILPYFLSYAQTDCEPCKQGDKDKKEKDYKPGDNPLGEHNATVNASCDPNEIVGVLGYDASVTDSLHWITSAQHLNYTIRFENEPTFATAAAIKVEVRLPIDANMDASTIGIGSFGWGSHVFAVNGAPSTYQRRIDLTAETGMFVDVVAGRDLARNEVFWIFQTINPFTGLPPTGIHDGFLAINDSTHAGEGFVTFTVKARSDIQTGDSIVAQATIVFDVNEEIPTNRWLNMIDTEAPQTQMTLQPNATLDSIHVNFNGTEEGSGIKQYRLYASQDYSSLQLLGSFAPDSNVVLPIVLGSNYQFYCLGEDNVGNVETLREQPDTTFGSNQVVINSSVLPLGKGTVSGSGNYTAGANASLQATPVDGYHFVRWSENGRTLSNDSNYTFVADRSKQLTAHFAINEYTLQTTVATGSELEVRDSRGNLVANGATVHHFDTLIVTASAQPCYTLGSLTLNGQAVGTNGLVVVTAAPIIATTATANSVTQVAYANTTCPGAGFNGYGFNILGTATQNSGTTTFTNITIGADGCDSITTLSLTIRNAHTITFNANGGNGTIRTQQVCSGETEALLNNTFTNEGYNFMGWSSNQTATTAEYMDGAFVNTTSDMTLYAVWTTACTHKTHTELRNVCGSYSFRGQTLTESGIYGDTVFNAVGWQCDSIYLLNLTVKPNSYTYDTAIACGSYQWIDNRTYTVSSDAITYSLTNNVGCDSIKMLNLTINPNATLSYNGNGGNGTMSSFTVCAGEQAAIADNLFTRAKYNFSGWSTTPDGEAEYASGNTLTLTQSTTLYAVWTPACYDVFDTLQVAACEQYVFDNRTLTASGIYSKQSYGVIAGGCDSSLVLNLTINHGTTSKDSVVACDSFVWHGNTYTTSGTSSYQTTNAIGCDSTVTLHLTINQSSTAIETAVACNSFTWHGQTYNASTTTPLYITTNAVGCDSVTTLHLTIRESLTATETVTACDSYTWHGATYTVSTSTPTFTTTSVAGCDSTTTLHLTVNYSNAATETVDVCDSYTWHGTTYTSSTNTPTFTSQNTVGCDSVTTLNLTVRNSNSAVETLTACDSYIWHGTTYTSSNNTATHTDLNAAGCDSVTTLNLTINYSNTGIETQDVCDSYTWNGTTYTTSTNTPTFTTQNTAGCDSVVTLNLTVRYSSVGTEIQDVCDSCAWHGTTYTASTTTPTFISQNAVGCDSVTTLNLTVRHSSSSIETATACDSYTWNGTEYTASGMSTYQTVNSVGCDSVATLYLTINNSSTGTDVVAACDSYIWIDGITYTASTSTPTFTIQNAMGCDSVITLQLTILESLTSIETVTACDSFAWHGTAYTISTSTPTFTTTSTEGCDSTVTLNLTINYSTTATETATACDSYTWNGTEYTASGTPTYQTVNSVGCDSVATLYLTINYSVDTIITDTAVGSYTWNGTTYTESGSYQWQGTTINGCDSTVTLMLVVNSVGIEMVDGEGISVKVYPNPTTGWITIDAEDVLSVEVYDQTGRNVAIYDNSNRINLGDLPTGSYLLKIHLQRGHSVRRVILK